MPTRCPAAMSSATLTARRSRNLLAGKRRRSAASQRADGDEARRGQHRAPAGAAREGEGNRDEHRGTSSPGRRYQPAPRFTRPRGWGAQGMTGTGFNERGFKERRDIGPRPRRATGWLPAPGCNGLTVPNAPHKTERPPGTLPSSRLRPRRRTHHGG
jgi:hypothetical protein